MSDEFDDRDAEVLAGNYDVERPDRESYEDPPSSIEGARSCWCGQVVRR